MTPYSMKDILERIRLAIDPLAAEVDEDNTEETAIFLLGARITSADGEEAVQTYIDVAGDYGVIQEALYSELLDQIVNHKNSALFQAIREVVQDLEEELGLDSKDEQLNIAPRVIH